MWVGRLSTRSGCKFLPCKGRGTTKWWRGVTPSRGGYPPSGLRPATSPCRGGWFENDHLRTLAARSHNVKMSQPPSKSDRMELRRATGTRALPVMTSVAYHRGPASLWPHACFDCQKSWKLPDDATGKCPECSGPLHSMGRAFKVPKKSDSEQWAKVRALWFAGFRFVNHTRWRDAEAFPERLREVEDFIRRNPHHPFRVAEPNGS